MDGVRSARLIADTTPWTRLTMPLGRVFNRMFRSKPAISPLTPGRAKALSPAQRERLLRVVRAQHKGLVGGRPTFHSGRVPDGGRAVADAVFATAVDPKLPDEIFPVLRWGGVFVYLGGSEARVRRLAEDYSDKRGFILERPVSAVHANGLGLRLPGITPTGYTFTARKTQLIQPGDFTERFTYHVELTPDPHAEQGYVVTKTVPTVDELYQRLRHKYPQIDEADIRQRAGKLVNSILPTFLSREAAILKILQRFLPKEHLHRVPRLLDSWKGKDGLVRRLNMNWLRVGGEPISQLEFARQSAELLRALHDDAGVIHLDLRLDNFVITPRGVGFVDFGSAVRVGENFHNAPMLYNLFAEMMRTSHIQQMLGRMIETGHVTNGAIRAVHGKVDRTVDSFYLAVQIQKPHGNPELAPLIRFEPESAEAQALSNLTAAILRPKDPATAQFKTAGDILRAIDRIERRVVVGPPPKPRPRELARAGA